MPGTHTGLPTIPWAPGHYPRSLQKSTDKTLVGSLVDTCLGWTSVTSGTHHFKDVNEDHLHLI